MNTRPFAASSRALRLKPLAACLSLVLASATVGGDVFAAVASGAQSAANTLSQTHALAMLDGFATSHYYHPGFAQQRAQVMAQFAARAKAHVFPNRPPAVVPVTSCLDDGSAGTLRKVVASAVSGDTVDLSALTCSTITLVKPAGAYGVNMVTYGDLTIQGPGADKLAIEGPGTTPNLYSADNIFRAAGSSLTIDGLTVSKGSNNNGGGCIAAVGTNAAINLINSTVSDCQVSGKYALGGGIQNLGGGGTITLTNSTVRNNRVQATMYGSLPPGGGGIYAYGGSYNGGAMGGITVTNSTISGNSVGVFGHFFQSYGGAILSGFGGPTAATTQGTRVVIRGSTISGNSAQYGGGVAVVKNLGYAVANGGTYTGNFLDISNSTISGNSATRAGGGILAMVPTTLHNSTVTGNSITGDVGGAGVVAANTLDIQSSIIANNSNVNYTTVFDPNLGVSLTGVLSGNHNLITSSNVALPADTISADPKLGALAMNGGPTRTHMLNIGSPAIDKGSNPDALSTDQRGTGFARVKGPAPDIGAVERQNTFAVGDVIFMAGFTSQ